MSATTPETGEVWQEADNCAILCMGPGRWLGYGNEMSDTFGNDDPLIAWPIRRLLCVDGSIAPERLFGGTPSVD